ncbi:hypothetical protein [Bradyrhizobium sp. RDM4]|uniref:hypothetical protein n=1 Tax=Bradyrhizobium sp. RDM4 TaxID=3378765 RepID=UPI0038FC74B4
MLIRQREKSDCAICTIAMALARTYEEVLDAALAAKAYEPGVGTRAEYAIIERFGLKQMVDFRALHRGVLAPEFFRQLSWGRRAILAVPSLNIVGSFHSVFWTGSELRDPCTLQTYNRWADLRPDELVLFAETGVHPK